MNRIFSIFLALATSVATAATLSPIQLLNPAGSTSGQAIVSTGPTTAPAWANVTAGGLTPVGANTVYANFTGSSASPTANAVPSCSAANSALKYTTSSGLSCGTTFALTGANTFTAGQTFSATNANLTLNDTSGSGLANLVLQSNATTFWQVQKTAANNFAIQRFTGGGVFQDNAMSIASATGIATFVQRPVFGSATPWDSVNLSSSAPLAVTNGGTGGNTQSAARTGLGLGTAATQNTGTSGANVPLLNGTNTWSGAQGFAGVIIPTSTVGIQGTTTNDAPAAGNVGERVPCSATISLTNNTPANVCSISLSAGDWEVHGSLTFVPAGSTTVTQVVGTITLTSATLSANPDNWNLQGTALTTGGQQGAALPSQSFQLLSGPTTVYCVAQAAFGVSTMQATCKLRARRPR